MGVPRSGFSKQTNIKTEFLLLILCTGEIRNSYKILVGENERKKSRGGHRRRWEDNIEMDLRRNVRYKDVD